MEFPRIMRDVWRRRGHLEEIHSFARSLRRARENIRVARDRGAAGAFAAAAFAGLRTPTAEEVHQIEAVAEPVVESACERYGQAAENGESTQERARPAWLTDYSLHMNLIGFLDSPCGSPPSEEAEYAARLRRLRSERTSGK